MSSFRVLDFPRGKALLPWQRVSIWVRPLYLWSISRGTLCAVAIKPVITTFVFSFRRKRKKHTDYYISLFLPGAEKRKLKPKLVLVRFFLVWRSTKHSWLIMHENHHKAKLDSGLRFFLRSIQIGNYLHIM